MNVHFVKKKSFLLISKICISIALLFFLTHTAQIKFELFACIFRQPFFLISIICLFLLMIVLGAWRWHTLNSAQEIHLGFFNTIIPTYLGAAFNTLLPGAVSGDFVRLYYLIKKIPEKKSIALFTILVDRIMGFIGIFIIMCFIAISHIQVFSQQHELFYLLLICAIFCISMLLALAAFVMLPQRMGLTIWLAERFRHKNWVRAIVSFLETVRLYRINKIVITKCLLISVLIQILIVCVILMIAKIMALPPISFSDYAIALGITQIVSLIPITPGGVGVGEMVFANVLLLLNPTISAAFATIFLAYRLISILTYLPGIICYIPSFIFARQKNNMQGLEGRAS